MPEPFAAYWILLAGALMPYPLVMTAKVGPAYDNADPRNPGALTSPFRQRAFGAHANCLEALPLFAAAVLLAGLRHAPGHLVDLLAWVWLGCRLVYVAAYLRGLASLRSLIWSAATAAAVGIFVVAVVQGSGA